MKNDRGYTLAEILTVSVILTFVIGSVMGAFVTTKSVCYASIRILGLQREANIIVERIIRGLGDPANAFGLRSATSFSIPASDPVGSEIDFIGTDGNTRKYFLSANSVIYESPTESPVQKSIYTAQANSSLTLRFWQPAGYADNETAGIYISISQNAQNRTLSGSLSTYVNIRNLPK